MAMRKLKDVDAAARLVRSQAIAWGLIIGVAMGVPVGGFIFYVTGSVLLGILAGPIACGGGVMFVSQLVVDRTADVFSKINNPSGDSTPPKREYSYERSLAMRGRYPEALAAFELAAIEYPQDPDPYFEAAKLCKDHLGRVEDAIAWYRRARADAVLTRGQELLAMQEIVQLYVHKLRQPRRAIPELAQLADRFPDTDAGAAAKVELGEMRDMLAREHEGFEKFTEQFLRKVGRDTLSQAAGLTRQELERQLITEALGETGGDRVQAAARLGVTIGKLEATMRDVGMMT